MFFGSTPWVLPRGMSLLVCMKLMKCPVLIRCHCMLRLYSQFLCVDPFGCMVVWWILIGFESGCLLISCRLMVSLAVCIHTLQKRKDLGEFRFWMKVCLWVIM